MTSDDTALVARALRFAAGNVHFGSWVQAQAVTDLARQLESGEVVLMRALDFAAIREEVRQVTNRTFHAETVAATSNVWQKAIEKAMQ